MFCVKTKEIIKPKPRKIQFQIIYQGKSLTSLTSIDLGQLTPAEDPAYTHGFTDIHKHCSSPFTLLSTDSIK